MKGNIDEITGFYPNLTDDAKLAYLIKNRNTEVAKALSPGITELLGELDDKKIEILNDNKERLDTALLHTSADFMFDFVNALYGRLGFQRNLLIETVEKIATNSVRRENARSTTP